MKKTICLMLAAVAICGLAAFSSCGAGEDNPAPTEQLIESMIVGKWINVMDNGEPTPTNEKMVLTFLSPTQAQFSISAYTHVSSTWATHQMCNVSIGGNRVSITTEQQGIELAADFTVTAINATDADTDYSLSNLINGKIIGTREGSQHWQLIETDYSHDILGTWEGRLTSSEGSEYDDGQIHRWEYMADGTYKYYTQEGDEWEENDVAFCHYFVDGTLLCTRWKAMGEDEHREWWEIEQIADDVMKWTALRRRADGTTYTATFEMRRVY